MTRRDRMKRLATRALNVADWATDPLPFQVTGAIDAASRWWKKKRRSTDENDRDAS